jgi:hypothetical protein
MRWDIFCKNPASKIKILIIPLGKIGLIKGGLQMGKKFEKNFLILLPF